MNFLPFFSHLRAHCDDELMIYWKQNKPNVRSHTAKYQVIRVCKSGAHCTVVPHTPEIYNWDFREFINSMPFDLYALKNVWYLDCFFFLLFSLSDDYHTLAFLKHSNSDYRSPQKKNAHTPYINRKRVYNRNKTNTRNNRIKIRSETYSNTHTRTQSQKNR